MEPGVAPTRLGDKWLLGHSWSQALRLGARVGGVVVGAEDPVRKGQEGRLSQVAHLAELAALSTCYLSLMPTSHTTLPT